ncbi:MAG: class I SAM-dependent methyltransferase [Chitinophagaceae bacterium]
MNLFLKNIFEKKQVEDKNGNLFPMHSNTSSEQCEFLQELIREVKPFSSLEIGLAYGISAVAILDELKKLNQPFHHTIMDPFQESWNDIGLFNIERAGLSANITFHRKFSDQVLPSLYNDNYRIQFAYIDSTKVFDVLMTDVYFINKILDVNGILVLDDCGFPGIRLLVRFLSQLPGYTIHKIFSKDSYSLKFKFLRNSYLKALSSLPFRKKVLPGYNFKTDAQLGVNYNCIAFRKVKEDDRNWDWYCSF